MRYDQACEKRRSPRFGGPQAGEYNRICPSRIDTKCLDRYTSPYDRNMVDILIEDCFLCKREILERKVN